MKKQLLILLFIFCCIAAHAQTNVLWEKVNSVSAKKTGSNQDQDKLYYKLNKNLLIQKVTASGKTSKIATSEITIPNAEGVLERFMVWESSNFEPELQAKYPEIRAYEGTGLDDKTAKIHFSVAPIGVQTMVLRSDKASEFIEQNPENKSEYVLFTSKNKDTSKSLICKTKDDNAQKTTGKTAKTTSNTKTFKTLRLALSCTWEYAAFFGGTKAGALEGMNATMTRVNGLFNRDLAVKLVIIANNEDVIFINSTDPYSNAQQGANGAWNLEVQQTLTTVIGNSGYDIGHLFGGSGGGGDAGCIGCVCDNPVSATDEAAKGSAFTSPSDGIPQGDTFDIDYVAHEMGHQLGATHTYSHTLESAGTNVEPGSGSTIMGYAGLTNYNVQNNSDDYFAYASILQIQSNLANKTCPVSTPVVNNNPPVISAGLDYIIPFNTPFILTGTGSDPDGDTLTYCWEQNDSATTATTGSKSIAYPAKPDGPMFRSLPPTSSAIRYMPSLNNVLQNKLTTTWESLSSVGRNLNFSLTGRDNSALDTPQTFTDNMVVTVNPTVGPFAVTSQNTTDIGWQKGSFQPITWNVNNTNTLAGSTNVNIKLSVDGGLTFPITLVSNTPNDGSETITVPSDITATNCRILIEPIANIYYALNANPFAIGYTSATSCTSYSFANASFSIPFGSDFTSKTITVPASTAIVSDVNVLINVTHERFSDLEIQIVNPQGTIVKLFDKECSAANSNLILGYDDSGVALDCSKTTTQLVLPVESLSVFNGQNPQGTWTFKVRDAVSGRFGTINSASVNICTKTFTLDNSEFEKIDFVLHPNPNKGNFTVQFDCDSTKVVEVTVHNVLGEKVYNKTFDKSPYFYQNIQMQNTTPGLYFVTITNGDQRIVKKILVN
ncbi:reprolysin-like metallopeptidase [Flavobacterium pectinovorum]|uniref:T9SS type A sorting domain-containing protein n=1 Tax=Flavobacterium pectinovorum TaxID=29533 RepID=UPI001FAB9112|nr:zinc-dependent metalloprotease family protein [Flavobacterium pectinovorum]MCI9844372.1 proprotein convertase P-domain-containing protein [Flavobacterium pectinovorum]